MLWPGAARAQRRRGKWLDSANSDDKEFRSTQSARVILAEKVANGTTAKPCLVVADQAAARGLHLDDLDAVFILGKPSSADSYLHMAGRTARSPFLDFDYSPSVMTLANTKDLRLLKSLLAEVAALIDFGESESVQVADHPKATEP